MTRKENLLVEIYNLRNQIAEIKGNTIVNIEEFSQTRKFRDEAAEWKEFELKLRIEELKNSLEKVKVEAAQQAAADAFYATDRVKPLSASARRSASCLAVSTTAQRAQPSNLSKATSRLPDARTSTQAGADFQRGRLHSLCSFTFPI